jgi:uncharacterized protein
MQLDALERGLRELAPEDFRLLAARIAHAISRSAWPPIRKLELVLTEDCNLRCDYCWIPKRASYMSPEVAVRTLDFVFAESRDALNIEITLFGGEPLLAWDTFTVAVEHAEKLAAATGKRVHWAVTTNGTLLNPENVRFAAQHGLAYLLSIDGNREAHDRHRRDAAGRGTFDSIVANIAVLKSAQPWLGARMTINPDTVTGLAESVRLLAHLGINQFLIGKNVVASWSKQAHTALYEEWVRIAQTYVALRRRGWPIRIRSFESPMGDFEEDGKPIAGWGCEAGQDKIAVTPSGDIYPCSRFLDADWLREATWLGHIDQGISADKTRRDITDNREVIRYRCMKCSRKKSCAGGCPATNWLSTGSPFVPARQECWDLNWGRRLRREVPEAYQVSKLPFRRHPFLGDTSLRDDGVCPSAIRPLN